MIRAPAAAAALLTLLGLLSAPPAQAFSIEPFRGHLAIGYARLFVARADPISADFEERTAPGGSLSAAGGVDVPVTGPWRVGVTLGYDLLGSTTEESGSLVANVDYSTFSALLLAHWAPAGLGPVARISGGAGVMNAHAELSTSGGGAAFSDLAVGETAPALALSATLMSHRDSPVRIGLELGAHVGFLEEETWSVATLRAAFHY